MARRVKNFSLEEALTRRDNEPAKKPSPGLATDAVGSEILTSGLPDMRQRHAFARE